MTFSTGRVVVLGIAALICTPSPRQSAASECSPRLERVLEAAGPNRLQLDAVLEFYRTRGDSLKLRAAEYLIENMEGKGYDLFVLKDSSGTAIVFDCLDYPDYESMIAVLDGIEAERGELDFEHSATIEDIHVMTADYLIENIDLAFRSWRERPWTGRLGFEDFCAYVLPHRGSGEPLEHWRSYFIDRYAGIVDQMRDPSDPVEAARLINEEIKSWFSFDPRFYCHPVDQGLSEMLLHRMGRCEDMTNLAIYAMRANGLAVTSDYTPYWADTGNNHAWNAILDAEGRSIMFMGCEAHPGEYKLAHRMAKVYRKTYAEQPGNLPSVKGASEEIPRRLASRSLLDVTSEYTNVSDVSLALEKPIPCHAGHAYLCVFNSGEWRVVAWGKILDGTASFTDVGTNIAYLPAYYAGEELIPCGPPFILESGGDVRPLVRRGIETATMRLISTTRRIERESTDGVEQGCFAAGKTYRLFFWDEDWVEVGDRVAEGAALQFSGVPAGLLYWLVEAGSRKEERIFTYEDAVQVWW